MSPLELLRLVMLVAHVVGLAAVIGPFLMQLRVREGFRLGPMRIGAVAQIVSGNLLIAASRLQGMGVIDEKRVLAMAIALLVLAALIVATVVQRRSHRAGVPDRRVRPWMISAGALAIANVVVAVVWS